MMKLKLTAAAAALVALSACDMLGLNRETNNTVATNNAAGNNATAETNESAGGKDPAGETGNATRAAFTGEVTREFLVGEWTDNNDCSQTIEFRRDGSFVAPGGAGEGLWALDGDRLTFQGERTISARVQAPDENTITLIHEDGSLGRSTRC
ncbi:MAG: hypothetical protein M3N07_05885 [Pseudomonadota bacterium]|nr:hypothetical protein [Pseudomonadota bacterium]